MLRQSFSPGTCLAQFKARATITGLAIGRRSNGKCDQSLRPLVSEQTITATAHVQLAS